MLASSITAWSGPSQHNLPFIFSFFLYGLQFLYLDIHYLSLFYPMQSPCSYITKFYLSSDKKQRIITKGCYRVVSGCALVFFCAFVLRGYNLTFTSPHAYLLFCAIIGSEIENNTSIDSLYLLKARTLSL